jgi:hypothetical protein
MGVEQLNSSVAPAANTKPLQFAASLANATLNPEPQKDFKDLDSFFDYFAHAQNGDDIISDAEFEQRIMEKLDFWRKNYRGGTGVSGPGSDYGYDSSRAGAKSINYAEFNILRYEFGLPFACMELGYWWKDNISDHLTATSGDNGVDGNPELSIADYLKRLHQQINLFSGKDTSAGVTRDAFKTHMTNRSSRGLVKPVITCYGSDGASSCWSSPYDVGAKTFLAPSGVGP